MKTLQDIGILWFWFCICLIGLSFLMGFWEIIKGIFG